MHHPPATANLTVRVDTYPNGPSSGVQDPTTPYG
jgi:hypothetical protein